MSISRAFQNFKNLQDFGQREHNSRQPVIAPKDGWTKVQGPDKVMPKSLLSLSPLVNATSRSHA